jgi:hypothetical protein
MSFIKISDAFKAGADWISATVRSFFIEQVPRAVDTVADVRDNDLEQARWIFVRSVGAFYRLSLSSTASDDGDGVIRDNIGRRYIKATSAVQVGFGASGTLANRANFNGEAKGFVYAQTDQDDLILYIKESNASGDWSEGFTWRGPPGVNGTNFSVDEIGTFAGRDAFDDAAPGFAYLSTDGDGEEIDTAVIFIMGDGGSGDWSAAVPFQGPQGPNGPGATIEIGTVSDVPYGDPATVENVGTSTAAVLNFGLPQGAPGDDGDDAYVYVAYASDETGSGFTTTFDAGLDYIAVLSTNTAIETPVAGDFAGLWKNYKGAPGNDGQNFAPDEVVALIADRDAFDDEPKGFAVLVESDAGNDDLPTLYFKLSGDSADWSGGFTFGGSGGGSGDMEAAVYDPQNIAGDAFDTDNHTDGSVNGVYTLAERSKLAAIEASADVTDAGNVGASIHGADGKTTPVDADTMPLIDSAASNVLKKTTWANLKATLISGGTIREVLTADRTYYVRTDGSDSNDGLTDSSGGAFLTIAKALSTVGALDLATYTATIQIGAGTFAENITIPNLVGGAATQLIIKGAGAGSTTIGAGSGNAFVHEAAATVAIGAFSIATGQAIGILAGFQNSVIIINQGEIAFPAVSSRFIDAAQGGTISVAENLRFSGNAPRAMYARLGGYIALGKLGGLTIYVDTTITCSVAFADCTRLSRITRNTAVTFDTTGGGVTGVRYQVDMNSIIDTAGSGATFFPGSSSGTTATGGQYG